MIPPFPHVLREERRGAKGWGEKQNVKEKKKTKPREEKEVRGGNKESGRRRANWRGRGDPEERGEDIFEKKKGEKKRTSLRSGGFFG